MAPAIAVPAAVSIGSAALGKSAAKKQQKKQEQLAREQMAMQRPLIEAQTAATQFGLDQGRQFAGGAQQAISDVKNWWSPIMGGDRKAIDMFLAPERGAINQGYQSAAQNVAMFGPRGGGRVSAMMNADLARQGQLSNLIYGARRQGVDAMTGLGQLQGQLGANFMGLGTQAAGAGSGAIGRSYGTMLDVMGRDQTLGILQGAGQQLGGLMNDFFKQNPNMGWGDFFKGGGDGGSGGSSGGKIPGFGDLFKPR